jgi:hypothetical protein
VRPVLAFERDDAPAKSAVAAVIRRSAGESEVRYPQFTPLPEDRLVPSDKAAQDRARMAQQRQAPADLPRQRRAAAQRFTWPQNVAPLPPEVLVRKDR